MPQGRKVRKTAHSDVNSAQKEQASAPSTSLVVTDAQESLEQGNMTTTAPQDGEGVQKKRTGKWKRQMIREAKKKREHARKITRAFSGVRSKSLGKRPGTKMELDQNKRLKNKMANGDELKQDGSKEQVAEDVFSAGALLEGGQSTVDRSVGSVAEFRWEK